MPLMRAAGNTELSTPPKDTTSILAVGQAPLPRGAASPTSSSSTASSDAVMVENHVSQNNISIRISPKIAANNGAAAVVQGLPPLPADAVSRGSTASTTSSVNSFSTVSSNTSASSAQTIQEGEFVMLHQNSNNSQQQQSQQSQQQQMSTASSQMSNTGGSSASASAMIGGADQLLAVAAAANSGASRSAAAPSSSSSSKSSAAASGLAAPANSPSSLTQKKAASAGVVVAASVDADDGQDSCAVIKPSTSGHSDAAVLSRVIESRAQHGLLDAQIDDRDTKRHAEEAEQQEHARNLYEKDINGKIILASKLAGLEERETLARSVLAREDVQARDIIDMTRVDDKKRAKRKSPTTSGAAAVMQRIATDTSSNVSALDKMEHERLQMLEQCRAEDEKKDKKRSPRSTGVAGELTKSSSSSGTYKVPDSFLAQAQEVLPAVARTVVGAVSAAVAGVTGSSHAAEVSVPRPTGCECMGASAGIHRVSCVHFKKA